MGLSAVGVGVVPKAFTINGSEWLRRYMKYADVILYFCEMEGWEKAVERVTAKMLRKSGISGVGEVELLLACANRIKKYRK